MGETETGTAEMCRLLVVGPTSRVDLSVPTHVPLSDTHVPLSDRMPALLRNLGPDLADRGLEPASRRAPGAFEWRARRTAKVEAATELDAK
jgi:hypothetical protein